LQLLQRPLVAVVAQRERMKEEAVGVVWSSHHLEVEVVEGEAPQHLQEEEAEAEDPPSL
jgi:hypothetical protein